jgi:hypothetical protein
MRRDVERPPIARGPILERPHESFIAWEKLPCLTILSTR